MADKGIRIIVEDLETGATDERVIVNDVCVIVQGTCYVGHVADYPKSGTQVYMIRGRKGRAGRG